MANKLQIKLLSQSGELLNVVTCYSGQISVLRATTASDLRPYQRALSGTHGPERFSVSIDGSEYLTQKNSLIGFGEPAGDSSISVREALETCGVSGSATDSLLLSYGMEQIADAKCDSLTPDMGRRLQLLLAVLSPDKALITNEPFEPISGQWRERFAELIVDFARQKRGLVVVSALSFRPECWIDNESVARIQVGESIQKTVGFGQKKGTSQELVEALRNQFKETPKPKDIPVDHPVKSEDFIHGWDRPEEAPASVIKTKLNKVFDITSAESDTETLIIRGLLIASTLLLVGLVFIKLSADKDPNLDIATNNQTVEPSSSNSTVTNPAQPTPLTPTKPTVEPPEMQLVLDLYPPTIKVSLLATMNNEVVIEGSGPSSAAVKAPSNPAGSNQGNLFKLLESAGAPDDKNAPSEDPYPPDNGNYIPPPVAYAPDQQVDDGDEEGRREAIRQKFLEAIRSAAERRSEDDGSGIE